MLSLQTYRFLTFASTGSPKRAQVEKFGFLRRVCMVFVVCAATAIASSAQIYSKVRQFQYSPSGLVQATDGAFYGTTSDGGNLVDCFQLGGCGTVFKITAGGALTTLYSFDIFNGISPNAALVQGTDGDFYGTTFWGGDVEFCAPYGDGDYTGCGTVFKITAAGWLTTLHFFSGTDGGWPNAPLVQGTDGNFYGTTSIGGTSSKCPSDYDVEGCGTVFKITAAGTLTTLHSFDVTDGAFPQTALVQATDGNFYGTTNSTAFKISPEGVLTTLHSFSGSDGAGPNELVRATDGNFYGTTGAGGVSGKGTVFKITPEGELTTLHSFSGSDGAGPNELVQATDRNFYGTTYSGGASGGGTVFKITPGGTLSTMHDFGAVGASGPNALMQATDGSFYGTTFRTPTFFRLRVFPAVMFSTASLNFGSQAVNEASAAKTVALTNRNSGGDMHITSITPSANFAVSSTTCGDTLAPGKHCTVSVTFTPPTLGKLTGTLIFTDNALDSPQTVALSGVGVEPATLWPATSNYAMPQAVGTTSLPHVFTLTNYQTVPLNNIVISPSGDFAVSSTTCATILAAKSKCTISVTFTPTATGKRNEMLSVSDDASDSPQRAALTGTGVLPAALLPATRTYPARAVGTTSAPETFTLTNHQGVTLSSIVISTSGDFAVSSTTCATTLAANSKCTISVTFTPTATGKRTGTLRVSDDASNSPQTAALTGWGDIPAILFPGSATYSAQAVGTTSAPQTFTLTNYETVELTNIVISTSGDFAVSSTTCTTSLAAKAKCTINVTFTPTQTGTRTGQLSVHDSAANSPQWSTLTGTGK